MTNPLGRLIEAVENNNLAEVKDIIAQEADVVKLVDERAGTPFTTPLICTGAHL